MSSWSELWWCSRCNRHHISATLYELKGRAFSNSRKPPKRKIVSDKMQGTWILLQSNCSAPQELPFLHPGDHREGVWLDGRSSMSKKSGHARTGAEDTHVRATSTPLSHAHAIGSR